MVRSWDVATDLPVVDVVNVFPAERAELVRFLDGLRPDAWMAPTACVGWTVHDVCLHLLGNDFGRLRRRTATRASANRGEMGYADLAQRIERSNEEWVAATRRITPPILVELLALTGTRVAELFGGLDPWSPGLAVAWTGHGPSPAWLDVAREYTERWTHHAHIREAVGERPLLDRQWLHPVLETFMRALPRAYAKVAAPEGATVRVSVEGDAGGAWVVTRASDRWRLVANPPASVEAEVAMPAEVAWKLLTRTVGVEESVRSIVTAGDPRLAAAATRAVAIMTTSL